MTVYPGHALAEQLETYLGSPEDPDAAFSYARCAELDRAEAFPEDPCAQLDAWGLQRYYVPTRFGGELCDFVDAAMLLRTVARRDLTVAIAHGKTFLGSVTAWVAPPSSAAERLAAGILAGHAAAWALTERDHGSDLLAGELRADAEPGGYRLTGEKWLINNATRARTVSVLARTSPTGGPRGFSVLLVNKSQLPGPAYRCLPKVPTHGIRGADISGIAFDDAPVQEQDRLGSAGAGLELVLKSLQLTRVLCAPLSLGAAEHALRVAMDFATTRRLYGRALFELPRARAVLADAYADLLLSEALAIVGIRSIQALTEELSVTSAVVKYLVPTRTDQMIADLGRLLGARSLLLDAYDGRFQKVSRDHRIVGIFDGNTLVNLNAIINDFPALARTAAHPPAPMAELFELNLPLPPFDPGRLRLVSSGGSRILRSLPTAVRRLADVAGPSAAVDLADRIAHHAANLVADLVAYPPGRAQVPALAFRRAQEIALCLAASAAINLWLGGHPRPDRFGAQVPGVPGAWLSAVLRRILAGLGRPVARSAAEDRDLLDSLACQHRDGWSMSLFPHRLAEGRPTCVRR